MDQLNEIKREIEDRAAAIREGEIPPPEQLPGESDEEFLQRVAEERRAEMGINTEAAT